MIIEVLRPLAAGAARLLDLCAAPGGKTTHLASMMGGAAGSPAVKGTCPFTDVKYSDYFYTAVTWAYEKGIAGGVSSSSFAPNAPVTREQIAVLLRNFAGSLGMSTAASGTLVGYSDYGSVSPWARDAMSWAVGHGIISGTGANTLSPAGRASRAQVAVMLYRLLVD